ncbi:uncharacterized protein LOC128206971 [Mya arenaria]|uniref:uncharacterized protein LOC128206971 n=1 Tax=Mya arenaria TaxID=6604 RepID=UPI0022E0B253|nr:uncharacterized protein LOC128206971 [Mya arenaria]
MATFLIGFGVLVGLLIVFSVNEVFGVKCYHCNTQVNKTCNDPFKKDSFEGKECPKGCMTQSGNDPDGYFVVNRGCSDMYGTTCVDRPLHTLAHTCYCSTSLCNSDEHEPRSSAAGVANVIVVLRVLKWLYLHDVMFDIV